MLSRTLRIVDRTPAARDQSIVVLDRSPELEAAYTRPGQYCLVRVGEPPTEGHFALIDPPGAGQPFRFLLRAGGPAADRLRAAPIGSSVEVRGPLGKGFAIEEAAGRDVLLVSAGAGISAIRPLLLTLAPAGRRVWLYHGTRTLDHLPFVDDVRAAQQQGAQIVIAVSSVPGTEGLTGRVQHAIERDKPDLTNAVAFLSGMEAMVTALRRVLPNLGLDASRIYLNY